MTSAADVPRKLERSDDCSTFDSGAAEIDDWLRRYAYENLRANNAITYVACADGKVIGFYSIAVAGVAKANAHAELTKGGVPSDIPCILLARLAVDAGHQGKGIGVGLLQDALLRAATISESVGARAVLIHARDEAARAFYEYHADCFRSPAAELQLMIPMKSVRSAFLAK